MKSFAPKSLLWCACLIFTGSCGIFQTRGEVANWEMKAEESPFNCRLTFWNDFEVLYKIEEAETVFLGYYRTHRDTVFIEIDRSLDENHKEIFLDNLIKWVLLRHGKELTLLAYYLQTTNTLEWKEQHLDNKKFYLLTSN